jgi:hypothetical protein
MYKLSTDNFIFIFKMSTLVVTLFNLIDPIKKQDGGWQDFGFKYLKN